MSQPSLKDQDRLGKTDNSTNRFKGTESIRERDLLRTLTYKLILAKLRPPQANKANQYIKPLKRLAKP